MPLQSAAARPYLAAQIGLQVKAERPITFTQPATAQLKMLPYNPYVGRL